MDIIHQYNQIGKDYIKGKNSFFSEREDWGTKTMLEYIGNIKNKIVLDMGCGDGLDSIKYLEMGAKVIGLDPSEYMIEQARRNLKDRVEFLVGGYENIPLKDKSVDLLVGRYSLHYLKEFDKAYKEIRRVLKDGGFFVLLVPSPIGDLLMKKEKTSDGEEVVVVPLYGGKVTIRYWPHTFSQYFSPEFLKSFKLVSFSEFVQAEVDPNIKVPTAMVIKAILA